ncbi:MAG TPA: zinc-dependent alcohol dehydrogenase family protein [Steroidobacteraceae bacterium]|nr:zinc-dependent alcohol dehydrogenase family protein [Steroidobacteraceae bacterium]
MRLHAAGTALTADDVRVPEPGPLQVLMRVSACGVCRTDLHLIDGELPAVPLPVTPGHEIVGRVVKAGAGVSRFKIGDRIGATWLGETCGVCYYCRHGWENLCERARFTGYHFDGGYADYALADARYCCAIPERYGDTEAAPLLCAGLIGYRAYRAAGPGEHLGLYGFGAAAHLLAQLALAEGRKVSAFTRPGDERSQEFARQLGVQWAGGSDAAPPVPLDAAIIFAPVGALVPAALAVTRPRGRVVCAGIHMSDVPAFPYRLLWSERSLVSVANLTRADASEFMQVAAAIALEPRVLVYPLDRVNDALEALRAGRLDGAAVLTPAAAS